MVGKLSWADSNSDNASFTLVWASVSGRCCGVLERLLQNGDLRSARSVASSIPHIEANGRTLTLEQYLVAALATQAIGMVGSDRKGASVRLL